MRAQRVVIIMPARNESQRISKVLEQLRAALPQAMPVVIDDASADDTADVALSFGARVLHLPVHLGYGGALQTGYRFAARLGADIVIQMDADGQHDPVSGPDLLEHLLEQHLDLVIGSRFHPDGPSYTLSPLRKIGMGALRWMAKQLLHTPISDPTSGYQALSRRLVDFYADWEGFPSDAPDADVLVWISRCGFRIGEVPVIMHPRTGGHSMHGGFEPIIYALKMGLALPLSASRAIRPQSSEDPRGGIAE
ncbi:MAG: glycosyltransferase family 2 protein [Candidatus Eisenbacteria bacterium]|uniref:Glycosyltransferase family 2 protein n=1 Tax=Eiseniibacteriota bacterium TaxID=2212470 RepID=A0A948RXL9_UNCEI|nr:glycosyltransferase family 2 protein [Candidatus Eisenbacteria bacterium]MBU1948263.1 glycosyltransferase family 2 protein [Candidatus Eisenbacteria bacterium]MBU2691427.1 glycosyltransferase family 2 protein [Candidatus Eisenbacteria bacterium]